MNMLKDLFNEVRNTPRLRWGIVLIIGTCWLYIILLLQESLQDQTRQHNTARLALVQMRAQITQTEWNARVAPAQTLSVQLESRLWQAATAGLAQAAFQDALNSAMAKAGAARPQISVTVVNESPATDTDQAKETETATPTDLWKVKAKLSFDFSAPALLELLSQIDRRDKQIIISTLSVTQSPPNRVDMELVAYFQKPSAQAPSQAVKP